MYKTFLYDITIQFFTKFLDTLKSNLHLERVVI